VRRIETPGLDGRGLPVVTDGGPRMSTQRAVLATNVFRAC
jgi:hypothetical protein